MNKSSQSVSVSVGSPDPNRYYMAFPLDTDEHQAASRFEAKYGSPPEYIFTHARVLWAGPIPENTDPRIQPQESSQLEMFPKPKIYV